MAQRIPIISTEIIGTIIIIVGTIGTTLITTSMETAGATIIITDLTGAILTIIIMAIIGIIIMAGIMDTILIVLTMDGIMDGTTAAITMAITDLAISQIIITILMAPSNLAVILKRNEIKLVLVQLEAVHMLQV
jgi:hypothetical protein